MPDPVHRIGIRVEASRDELWTFGQALRYVRDRNIVWARLAPPFLSQYSPPTLEGKRALWALWQDIMDGTAGSDKDIRARGIVNPGPLLPNDRQAIFDLLRELEFGAVHAIQKNYREAPLSHWSPETLRALEFQERIGETTGDFGPFLAEAECLMGDMLFPAPELIKALSRRTPFQLAGLTPVAPAEAIAPMETGEPTPPARKPTRRERTVEALPRLFPAGWGEKTHEHLLKRLKKEGLEISDRTLKRALSDLAAN